MDLPNLKFLSEYMNIYWLAVLVTVVALAISTRYTIKMLLKTTKNIPSSTETHADVTSSKVKEEADADGVVKVDDVKFCSDEDGIQGLSGRDPLDYCSHIQGEVKRVKQRVTNEKIQENLTKDQLDEERKVQSEQLAYIFKLMAEQGDKFGIKSMDDVQQQMKLYA